MAQKFTIWQRLNRAISGVDQQATPEVKPATRFEVKDRELLRTNDKEDFRVKKLEYQQSSYLNRTVNKVDAARVNDALVYETTRLASYSDFEAMEFFPEIAAALDIMMEESTTLNSDGRMINVYSDSTRVKGEIEDLLFNRLDIHTTLPMYIRNMCKYGDNFLFLNLQKDIGVVNSRQLPNFEIERKEGDIHKLAISTDPNPEELETSFSWPKQDLTFQKFQIAHFRLLGDDRRLPYGSSILEKARRIWKQLVLSEDSMLVYRITRAPERRVFKIFVGNIDPADVGPYIDEIANRFKRSPIIDPRTGQLDVRFNQLSNDQDYFIPVRSEDAPNPIDTLPGATNLGDIADIEFLQNKLFTALRVPKPFLGFSDAAGDGKNLSLQDIRFARTINRIQQSAIQALNQIIITHLILIGFKDEIRNFTITMNNPSNQAEVLRIELEQSKVTLYKDAVSDAGNGFGTYSMTRGKKKILGMSDDDIKEDLLQQRMEKAAAAELLNTASVIKHTGVFDVVDRIYGDMEQAMKGGTPEGEGPEGGDAGGSGGGGGLGGSFGGGGLSPVDMDFDEDNGDNDTEAPDENADNTEGGTEPNPDDMTDITPTNEMLEILKKKRQLLKENQAKRIKRNTNIYFNRLVESISKGGSDKKIVEVAHIEKKNELINESLNKMVGNINKLLGE